ncbi:MAG: hypothetical protein ABWZ99_15175 [Ilumatobacteraceae bacterium]
MRTKLITAIAVAGVGIVSFTSAAGAAPRDGRCVAANLSALPGAEKSAVAKSGPGALAGVIQLHLDGELDLLGVCSS